MVFTLQGVALIDLRETADMGGALLARLWCLVMVRWSEAYAKLASGLVKGDMA